MEPKLRNRRTHTENWGLPEVGVGGERVKGVKRCRLPGIKSERWAGTHGLATPHCIICELLRSQRLGSDSTLRTANTKPELHTRRKGCGQVANFPWRAGESFQKRVYPGSREH